MWLEESSAILNAERRYDVDASMGEGAILGALALLQEVIQPDG